MKIQMKKRQVELVRMILQRLMDRRFRGNGFVIDRMGMGVMDEQMSASQAELQDLLKVFGVKERPSYLQTVELLADMTPKQRGKNLERLTKGFDIDGLRREAKTKLSNLELVIKAYADTKVPKETKARMKGLAEVVAILTPPDPYARKPEPPKVEAKPEEPKKEKPKKSKANGKAHAHA